MVGVVLVSHSRPLAQAILDLVRQMVPGEVPIAVAAGIGEQRDEFGTDAVEISAAIQSVYSPDGVVVLMDLGSAILSAEMALELLPEEMHSRIRFCAAPLVEGAIVAGVQAGLGSDLHAVCQEAQDALLPKLEHLRPVGTAANQMQPMNTPLVPTPDQQEATLEIRNLHGLHARPAARFVQTAAIFNADVRISNATNQKGPVSARSLNAVATLGAVRGHQIVLSASGVEATQAIAALTTLIESGFGEETGETESAPASVEAANAAKAQSGGIIPISEGAALGPLFRFQPAPPEIPEYTTDNPGAEWERLGVALEQARQVIRQRRRSLAEAIGEQQAAIFDAHLLILDDPELIQSVRTRIERTCQNAAAAWMAGIDSVAETYRQVQDEYLQARAIDVMDVGKQVLLALLGSDAGQLIRPPQEVILFAEELTPTETAQIDMTRVLGIVTVTGGPTAHSAILARGLGIPAVSGVDPSVMRLQDGTLVGLNGFEGQLWIEPDPATQVQILSERERWLATRKRLKESAQLPASTRDGQRIEVVANIGSLQDARAAVENGAEGVGLLRTEFLFLTRSTAPTEGEQVAALQQIIEVMGSRPVIVRTLDVGGDKELPYISMPPEPNPFLGVRALRLSLRKPELFQSQLRSILRAGVSGSLRIMYPMVANLDEILQARDCLEQAHQSLIADNLPHAWPIQTGIMVEIPAAAIQAQVLAPHVDFFSIGTNDLTQYTLAAERGSPLLAHLADALHPAVLHLVGQVTAAAHAHGKWVGVCGELAGDPLAVPILVGLGVDELSMNPGGIGRVKAILRQLDLPTARQIAELALTQQSAAAARAVAKDFYITKIEPNLT